MTSTSEQRRRSRQSAAERVDRWRKAHAGANGVTHRSIMPYVPAELWQRFEKYKAHRQSTNISTAVELIEAAAQVLEPVDVRPVVQRRNGGVRRPTPMHLRREDWDTLAPYADAVGVTAAFNQLIDAGLTLADF